MKMSVGGDSSLSLLSSWLVPPSNLYKFQQVPALSWLECEWALCPAISAGGFLPFSLARRTTITTASLLYRVFLVSIRIRRSPSFYVAVRKTTFGEQELTECSATATRELSWTEITHFLHPRELWENFHFGFHRTVGTTTVTAPTPKQGWVWPFR